MPKSVSQALLFLTALTILLATLGCQDEKPLGFSPFLASKGEATGLSLFLSGLHNSTHYGYHFEAWAVVDGAPISLGKFTLDAEGKPVDLNGAKIERFNAGRDIAKAERVEVTLEPRGDADPSPSPVVMLSGDVAGLMATLTVPIPPSFLDRSRGSYILATPTDGGSDTNETSGVWFIDPAVGPGLDLPFLPPSWKYEGWVMTAQGALSTGKFVNTLGHDMSRAYSGPDPGPPYPGEDFLFNPPSGFTFPARLRGARLVVTIEPWPDDHTDHPFQLEVLSAMIPADAKPFTVYTMENTSQSFPSGQAILF